MGEARDAVQRIIRDGKRASEVIARIRSLSKKSAAEKEPLDLNETITEVVAFTQGEVRRTRVTLRTDLASDLPRIIGDRVQLQQVVLNLVLNGLEAMGAVADRPRELVIETKLEDAEHVCVASGMWVSVSIREHQPTLRRVLHHEAWWNGDGSLDQPLDHREPWRQVVGRSERRSGSHLSLHGLTPCMDRSAGDTIVFVVDDESRSGRRSRAWFAPRGCVWKYLPRPRHFSRGHRSMLQLPSAGRTSTGRQRPRPAAAPRRAEHADPNRIHHWPWRRTYFGHGHEGGRGRVLLKPLADVDVLEAIDRAIDRHRASRVNKPRWRTCSPATAP